LKPELSELDSIKTWLSRLSNWEQIITSNIRNNYLQGFINITGKGLKDNLHGKVKKEQGNIRGYLQELTTQKGKDIFNALDKIKTILGKPAHSLQNFVDYVNNLKLCKNQKDNLVDDKKRLEEMNTTLKKYRTREDLTFSNQLSLLQGKIDEISNLIIEIEDLLSKSEGFVSESKESHINEIEIKIQEERDKIAQHIDKLQGETLLNPDTDPADAIKQIVKIKKEFDDTVGKLTRYRQYQESLDIAPVEIKELNDFQKKYDVRYKLWNNLKTFREKSNMWLTKAFRD
jgi:hypothetical protein